MWVLLALGSAVCFGFVSVVDKRLLYHHLPGVSVLYLWIALVLTTYAVIVLAVTGIPQGVSAQLLAVALGSGLATGVGLALMFLGLKLEEASRAIAITQIYPVVVAALAVLFLGETLAPFQWAAITLVVLGAMLISLRGDVPGSALRPTRGTPVLVGGGFGLGLGFFAAKFALEGLSVATVFALQQLGVALIFGLFARPVVWRQLFRTLKRRNSLVLLLVGEGFLPIVAIVLGLWAISLGPVSLVTAFLATRPLFLFLLATLLSSSRWQLMEESLSRKSLALKFVSIVMIVAGVGALGMG
jgi:drug/metabolite transporter (DMT)-like permease